MQDADGKTDWMMRYVPGPKAKNEFEFFTGKAGVLETKIEAGGIAQAIPAELELPQPSGEMLVLREAQQSFDLEPVEQQADPELVAELLKRGIAGKQAAALLLEVRP